MESVDRSDDEKNNDGSAEGLTNDIFKRGDELTNNNSQTEQTFNTQTGILTNTWNDTNLQIKTRLASSTENGERYLTLTPYGNKAAQKWTSDLAIDLITTIKSKDLYLNRFGKNVPDFTTPTNYSIVVDAEIADADAYGLFLNGAINYKNNTGNVKNAENSGYLFHYGWYGGSPYQNRLKMRLISGMADNTQKTADHLSDISAEIGYDHKYSVLTGKYYHWTPSYLQNDLFTPAATKKFWHSRRRMIYTILEYYDVIEGIRAPRYIVRARYLKRPEEVLASLSLEERYRIKKLDPWYTGKLFFDSEPSWWGGYVGVAPEKTNDPLYVKYKIMNYTNYAEKYWETLKVLDIEDKTRYPLKWSASDTAVLTAKPMDIIDDVIDLNKNNSIDIFKDPKRERFLGINVWVENIKSINDIGMKLFEFNLAPGFSKEELKAIMPQNAKMYELSELIDSGWQSRYPWLSSGNYNMNNALFSGGSSNGEGNGSIYMQRGSGISGIMGLQHIPGNACGCPLCRRQEGKEY